MSNYNQDKLTQDVVNAFGRCSDERLHVLMTSLVKHVHAFAREVDLTPDEWMAGLQFLTATGKMCDDKRQEFILLSDTLGMSMLVVAMAQARASGQVQGAMAPTEATVQGPFFWEARRNCRWAPTSARACPASPPSTTAA